MMSILEQVIPYDDKSHQWPQVLAICITCLSTSTSGLLYAWTSPSIPILTSSASHIEPISIETASYFTVIPPLASIITGPIFAYTVDVFGRKKAITFIAVPQILSFLLIALAENTATFYVSRFFMGVADSVLYNSVPMYVGEITEPKVRGSWGNLVAISINVGVLLINIIGAYCDIRTTAYICACFPVAHLVLSLLLPESPYFLIMKNKTEEARTALKKLRWREDVEEELVALTKDVNRQISESGTFKDLFTIPSNRKALLVAVGMRSTQQFSGLAAFTLYTPYMFTQTGTNISASTSAIIYSAAVLIFISVFALVVDKFGRRRLMVLSCAGCALAVAIETAYFYLLQETKVDVSYFNWVPLAGLLLYTFMCFSGLGIIPTLMLGELFSASVKGKALYVYNIFFCLGILSVSKIFQFLAFTYGMYVPFCLFTLCSILGLIFSYCYVPETKGKTLEEIQQTLKARKDK